MTEQAVATASHNGHRVARGGLAAAALLAALWPAAAAAEFRVAGVRASVSGNGLEVNAQLELSLSDETTVALQKGVPLEIASRFRLYRHRPLLWDSTVGEWERRVILRYHALSGRYIASNLDGVNMQTFMTLRDALAAIGDPGTLRFPLPQGAVSPGDRLRMEIGVHLDIEALPAPLRPLAYTSRAWRLSGRWTEWLYPD